MPQSMLRNLQYGLVLQIYKLSVTFYERASILCLAVSGNRLSVHIGSNRILHKHFLHSRRAMIRGFVQIILFHIYPH